MNCALEVVRMPSRRCRVVCALREVMLMRAPTRALIRVDLPTLGLPTIATSPHRKAPSPFTAASARGRLLIRSRGSRLLGGAPAGARTRCRDVECGYAAFDVKALEMGL